MSEHEYQGIQPASDPESPEARKVQTAFMIIIEESGTVVVTNEVTPDIELSRQANLNDMYIGATVAVKDLTALEVSQRTAQVMLEVTQSIAQAQQEAQKKPSLIAPPKGLKLQR